MEDSSSKTIDYLRARLLAERSVSKTARERANELAKRVTELEKQLKVVSLQRKKAEKAAADVLAILENHGKNDVTEPIDSSFDEELSSDFVDDKHVETEEFSGSEVESSSVNGKSLSWKSSKNTSSRFLDKKYMDASRRRRNSFTSTGSSPRHVGKSCRRIRHRERRSGADVSLNDDATNGHHENGQTSSEGIQNSADLATEASLEETVMCNGHAVQNNGTETDMERALEHQAQFIAQYEEEEKAQREWEDKFRETNGSTPENSCDHGTHSDVTDERAETKPPSLLPPGATEKLTSGGQSFDHGVVDPNLSENPTKTDPEPLPDHNTINEPLDSQSQPPVLQGTPTNLSQSQASSSHGKSHEPDLETGKEQDKLGSVLEALQLAKLSLRQNLDKFPLLENGPSVPTYRGGEKIPVPFSSAGLFRVPSDYEYEGTPLRASSLTYDPRLSLTNYPTDDLAGRQFMSSPYRESFSRSTSSLDDRYRMVPTFPYQETMPEIPRLPPSVLDPRLDIHPSAHDRRLDTGMGPPALDPRLGMNSSIDPRLSRGPSALDPRLGAGPSALDPRLGVGPSSLDPRLSVGPSTVEPRLAVGHAAMDPRLGVGQTAFDPRLDMGPPYMGDGFLNSSARLPMSSRYGTRPGGDIPLQTRSLYDGYTRPNTYK